MDKKILTGIVSTTIILVLLYGAYLLLNPAPATYPEVNRIKPADHVTWAKERKNILVEYSDFQCPACKTFHDYIQTQIVATTSSQMGIPQKITFVFRNFPLYQIHPDAFDSAYAAEAAGRQGKFFEMVDALYANQADWADKPNPKDYFVKLAQKLKLDINRFKKDMDSKAVKDKVDADLKSGERADINQTPTFFLNGKKLDIQSFDQFRQILLDAAK